MIEGLTSFQLAEMEAYARIEADPEGEEARAEKAKAAAAARLEELKGPFFRASKASQEAANGNRSDP